MYTAPTPPRTSYFVSSEFMINLSGAFTTALTTALVTVYISVALNQDRQAAGKVASRVLSLFLLGAAAVVVLLDLFAPEVGWLLAPAYTEEQSQLLAHYLRLFSVAFLFSAIQSIYAAVQNANDIFIPGKLYGVIYNPVAIFCMLALGERLGLSALVYAYYIANVIQVVFLHLRSRGLYRFTPTLGFRDENVVKVWRLALPVLVSNVLIQLNGVVDKAICSYLGEGMASSYTYANTLEQFVTGTFTATINLILLSRFAELVTRKDQREMKRTLTQAATLMVLILAPVALITVLSAMDIVSLVYYRGEFTMENVHSTTLALVGFAVGFPIIALRELLIRVHFAYQETKSPMVISMISGVQRGAEHSPQFLGGDPGRDVGHQSVCCGVGVLLEPRREGDAARFSAVFPVEKLWKVHGGHGPGSGSGGGCGPIGDIRCAGSHGPKAGTGLPGLFLGIVGLHHREAMAFWKRWRGRR